MNHHFSPLKSSAAAICMLMLQAAVMAEPPDTTLLDSKKKPNEEVRGRRSGQPAPMAYGTNQVAVLSSPPGGLGVVIGDGLGGVLVRQVVRDGPAWRAGVHEGDLIVAIDHQPMDQTVLHRIALRLRGPIGSAVTLSILRSQQDKPVDLKLKRDVVKPPSEGFQL